MVFKSFSWEISTSDRALAARNVHEAILDIWRRVLGHSDLSLQDDFFELGGHSVHALQIAIRTEAAFGISLRPEDFFDLYTAGEMAERVAQLLAERTEAATQQEQPKSA